MSNQEHTPGPWSVNARYPFWVEDPDGCRIVDVEGTRLSSDESIANARLIAAAPDLLAACDAALLYLHDEETDQLLRAAIAKARGEGEP